MEAVERVKHLRWCKRRFWKGERRAAKREAARQGLEAGAGSGGCSAKLHFRDADKLL